MFIATHKIIELHVFQSLYNLSKLTILHYTWQFSFLVYEWLLRIKFTDYFI